MRSEARRGVVGRPRARRVRRLHAPQGRLARLPQGGSHALLLLALPPPVLPLSSLLPQKLFFPPHPNVDHARHYLPSTLLARQSVSFAPFPRRQLFLPRPPAGARSRPHAAQGRGGLVPSSRRSSGLLASVRRFRSSLLQVRIFCPSSPPWSPRTRPQREGYPPW